MDLIHRNRFSLNIIFLFFTVFFLASSLYLITFLYTPLAKACEDAPAESYLNINSDKNLALVGGLLEIISSKFSIPAVHAGCDSGGVDTSNGSGIDESPGDTGFAAEGQGDSGPGEPGENQGGDKIVDGDSGYVPSGSGGSPVQTLTDAAFVGCDREYPLVRYNFTASWSTDTVKFEVWRKRQDLDNWTVIRELAAPGSYLDNRLSPDSYSAPFVEYAIRRIDTRWGNIESNHLQISVQNCNPTTAPPAPPPDSGGGTPSPPPANASVTLSSVNNGSCSGVYPRVNVDFTSNFNPAGGYELWHFNNPYRGWEKFGNASTPGTYTDTMADSNWYQGVTTYMVRAIDPGGNRLLDSNNVAITTANCNSEVAGGGVVTLNSALNSSCNGIYPVVSVNFSSNFNPPGGYELWHHNNPYRDWQVFNSTSTPGTYTDTMADSNWYRGVTTYMVRAIDSSGGRLVDSNNISMVTANCNPPSSARFIPPSPKAYCSTNEGRITLSWTIPQNFNVNSSDRYYIQRVDGADNRIEYGPTELNSFEDGSISIGQIYSYNIRAVTQNGGSSDSGWSSSVTSLNCNNPLVNLYVNNSRALVTVKTGTEAQIKWDSTNSGSCTASSSPSQANWNGVKPVSGTDTTGILTAPPSEIRYTLTCTNTDTGVTDTGNVDVKIEGQRPCLKTTGGDVHSNEGISAPEGCN